MPITLDTARKIKAAGLPWLPAQHDFFAIPDRGLDDKVFVIADMTVLLELLHGHPAVTFHGTAEWALDYMFMVDTLWLPTEEQLRGLLEQRLLDPAMNAGYVAGDPAPVLRLERSAAGHRCTLNFRGQSPAFDGPSAGEAYAEALLYIMDETRPGRGS